MDICTPITRRTALVAAGSVALATTMPNSSAAEELPTHADPAMAAMIRIRQLSREIAHLLNDMPHEQRVTIEPSASAVYPVLMEDMNPDVLPDHLAMMNRGLAIMERGAKLRDERVLGLGMLWGIDASEFQGVAVNYSRQPGA